MNKIKILHLEDDPDDSELVLTELKSAEFEIEYTRVDNEKDFRNQLENNKFNIILADYNLPTFDGISALRICAEKYPETPFIIVSGTLGEEIAVEMLKYGAADYLLKQNLKRLVTAVEHSLKEASLKQEKVKTEKELKESEEKFRTITENSADAIFVVDQSGKYVFTNKKVTELLGYSKEEMVSITLIDLAPDNQADKFMFLFNQLLSKGKVTGEVELLKKDGTFLPVDINAVVLPGGLLYGSCRDISEKKLAEKELIESEKKYRSIFENIQDVYYQIDINGNITAISPSIKRLSGYTPEELIGKPSAFFYLYPEERKSLLENLSNKGEVWDYEIRMRTRDEQIKYTSLNAHLMFDTEGKPIGIEGSLRDVNERKHIEIELKKAKEKAEESDRLKSAFLTNISHEIRTPMNGILGFTELLKEPNLSSDDQQDYIQTIQISGARMLNTINSIVDISKIESGLMKVDINETNINEKIEFTYKFFKPEAEIKGLHLLFKNSLPAKEAIIKTDNEKVYGMLTNLIRNAIKFTYEGSIEFGYEKKGKYLEFFVKDTGVGIPKNQMELIFERFRQGSESHNRGYEGSGLGLSIAKSYVEMLGGEIWVESEEGKGSTFYFTIPYNAVSEEKIKIVNTVSEEQKEVEIKKLKTLIVEDDEISYSLLTRMLQKISKEVLHAITGVQAVEVCRNNPDIDLVLMDIRMPVMDGNEATRQIRQFNTNVIIIAQTAYAFAGDKELAIEAGCNDYISKPINSTTLFELIKKNIRHI
jgi:PAS domain S-box-containing protein